MSKRPYKTQQDIEKEYGMSLKAVLMQEYPKYESTTKLAQALGVSQPTVINWLIKSRLKIRSILVED